MLITTKGICEPWHRIVFLTGSLKACCLQSTSQWEGSPHDTWTDSHIIYKTQYGVICALLNGACICSHTLPPLWAASIHTTSAQHFRTCISGRSQHQGSESEQSRWLNKFQLAGAINRHHHLSHPIERTACVVCAKVGGCILCTPTVDTT